MKNNLSEARIREISREVVEKSIPEEIGLFDSIWQVMKKFIARWKDDLPQEWHETQFSEGFLSEMGFLDEAEVAEINTPKVIALISLVWLRLTQLKGNIRKGIIEETIAKYGSAVPEWLRIELIKLAVPMIEEDLIKTGRIHSIEEEKKYVMYSHDANKGKPISESYFNKIEMNKNDYFIWLNEKNREFLIKGKTPPDVYPEERRALACLVKNNGDMAYYWELYGAIHNIKVKEDEWPNMQKDRIGDIYKVISDLFNHCPELKKYKKTESGYGYKLILPVDVKYCLIIVEKT